MSDNLTNTSIISVKDSTTSLFDSIRYTDKQNEYWSARELQPILGYKQWRQFRDTVEKAKLACQNSGINVQNHFADVRNKVQIGSGAIRDVEDYNLSRYACYLTAMNGDPRKEEISAAQTYFAIKTRQAELQQQDNPIDSLDILEHQVKVMRKLQNQADQNTAAINSLRSAHNGMSLRHESKLLQQQKQLDHHEEEISDIKQTIATRSPRSDIRIFIDDMVKKYKETEYSMDYGHAYACFYQELRESVGFELNKEQADLRTKRLNEGWSKTRVDAISKLDTIEDHPEIWSDIRSLISRLREDYDI